MQVGVLGTGMVGRALSGKVAALGHETWVGTRDVPACFAQTEPARDGSGTFAQWHERNSGVQVVPFAEAAANAEVVLNATPGAVALDVLTMAGAANLEGKVLLDVSNPLDFSHGMPPSLFVCNTESLAERIQDAFPAARVVKSLNTVNAHVMVDPVSVAGGEHTMFVAGNDDEAKAVVTEILRGWFGWKHVIDLGDLTGARAMEMYLPLWLRIMQAQRTPAFNIAVAPQPG